MVAWKCWAQIRRMAGRAFEGALVVRLRLCAGPLDRLGPALGVTQAVAVFLERDW